MRNFLPLLSILAAFAAPSPGAALTAQSTEDCIKDLGAIDATLARLSAGNPDPGLVSLLDLLPDDKHPVFLGGYCVIPGLRFPQTAISMVTPQYGFATLRWQADWADASRPMPPDGLVLDVKKATMTYLGGGNPGDELPQMMAYQSRLMADIYPNDFRLELAFDRQTDRLEIRQLAAQNGFASRIAFSATLQGADLDGILSSDWSAAPPLDKLALIAIENADLSVTNGGLFEAMSMSWLPLIYPLLGDTPDTAVGAAQDIARDQVAQAPDALIGPDSKAVLNAVIDSLPHPIGTLRLQLEAPNGITLSRVATTQMMVDQPTWDSFAGSLDGASLKAEWTSTAWPAQPLPALTED